jgi:iron complex transport system substrate-binding protein
MPRPLPRSSLSVCILLIGCLAMPSAAGEAGAARRIVSLNPSLTAILLALGAGDALVGVDDFSARQQSAVAQLPRVGGLFNPSLEAVVALEPDLVVLVPSAEQRDFQERLESFGIALEVFPNIRFDEVLENIERLGRLVDREREARARIEAIRGTRTAVARVAARRGSPRALMILQRSPIFIVGRGSFIDEMLTAAGASNVGAGFDEPYPRVAAEWLVAAAPEVILDMSPDPEDAAGFWSRWPTIPAVAAGRVQRLEAERVTLPGPHLDRALETLAAALYGDGVLAEVEAEREALRADAAASGP